MSVFRGLRRRIIRSKIVLRNWRKYMKVMRMVSSLLGQQLLKIDFRRVSVSEICRINVLYRGDYIVYKISRD